MNIWSFTQSHMTTHNKPYCQVTMVTSQPATVDICIYKQLWCATVIQVIITTSRCSQRYTVTLLRAHISRLLNGKKISRAQFSYLGANQLSASLITLLCLFLTFSVCSTVFVLYFVLWYYFCSKEANIIMLFLLFCKDILTSVTLHSSQSTNCSNPFQIIFCNTDCD